MALEVRGFEWPRKQPEAPRAKNCLLALAMFSSTPCLADNERLHNAARALLKTRGQGQSPSC